MELKTGVEIEEGFSFKELSSEFLLVTFGGINKGIGIPVFEFKRTIEDIDCDKLFIRDLNQSWYQKGIDAKVNSLTSLQEKLRSLIEAKKYKKVCFVGNSMGGYAAILFGTLLKVDQVIAFAPQSFISRFLRFIYFDRRWPEQMKSIHGDKEIKNTFFDLRKLLKAHNSSSTSIEIFYSKNHRQDKCHAERLHGFDNVILNGLTEGGHGVVKTIKNRGDLKNVINKAFVS